MAPETSFLGHPLLNYFDFVLDNSERRALSLSGDVSLSRCLFSFFILRDNYSTDTRDPTLPVRALRALLNAFPLPRPLAPPPLPSRSILTQPLSATEPARGQMRACLLSNKNASYGKVEKGSLEAHARGRVSPSRQSARGSSLQRVEERTLRSPMCSSASCYWAAVLTAMGGRCGATARAATHHPACSSQSRHRRRPRSATLLAAAPKVNAGKQASQIVHATAFVDRLGARALRDPRARKHFKMALLGMKPATFATGVEEDEEDPAQAQSWRRRDRGYAAWGARSACIGDGHEAPRSASPLQAHSSWAAQTTRMRPAAWCMAEARVHALVVFLHDGAPKEDAMARTARSPRRSPCAALQISFLARRLKKRSQSVRGVAWVAREYLRLRGVPADERAWEAMYGPSPFLGAGSPALSPGTLSPRPVVGAQRMVGLPTSPRSSHQSCGGLTLRLPWSALETEASLRSRGLLRISLFSPAHKRIVARLPRHVLPASSQEARSVRGALERLDAGDVRPARRPSPVLGAGSPALSPRTLSPRPVVGAARMPTFFAFTRSTSHCRLPRPVPSRCISPAADALLRAVVAFCASPYLHRRTSASSRRPTSPATSHLACHVTGASPQHTYLRRARVAHPVGRRTWDGAPHLGRSAALGTERLSRLLLAIDRHILRARWSTFKLSHRAVLEKPTAACVDDIATSAIDGVDLPRRPTDLSC
ncbi:hypothetical protein GGX14DRAFT_579034 [Mycena pura]|uniref:Uncharacterized protein n=1 Tax=Mycena pura TaxID=153505 RepID=A0AAD6UNN8_9AGAR|nr:hypothetical protein GGX14DRAFT_579034 [Mycena pura]